MANLFDLTGRVAIVTGAAQGLGRATALALAEAGADLLLADRNTAGIEKTAAQITRLGRRGVPVNAVLPAQIVNPSLEARMAADPNLKAKFLSGLPIGRMGQPDDIRGLMVLLASDASAWITGAIIPLDGGNLALNAGGTKG